MAETPFPYTPSHVANFFLRCAKEEGKSITHLKLQKLVFLGYGWVSSVLKRELFDTKHYPIHRYRYGPVIESLYHEFKSYGKRPLDEYSSAFDNDTGNFEEKHIPETDDEVYELLSAVWTIYKRFSGEDLVYLTHRKGTPWDDANHRGKATLSPKVVRKYFDERIEQYLKEAGARP